MRRTTSFGCSLFVLALWLSACAPVSQAARPTGSSVVLAGQRFTVEVAATPAAQEHGLMQRASMAPDHGMLFVFADDQPRTFWMKHTLIPLDILFFDDQRQLVAIQADAQPCHADPCRLYPSGVPARYVLELNAGTAARIGARQGDVIGFANIDSGTQ